MNRLVLIDGNAIMHRAYHALPPLTSPSGRPVHIVYGFVSMMIKIFHDLKPTHVAVAFDRPGPTFREKLFPAYQSQRPKMEDDFVSQIPLVHDMVSALGIPAYESDGFEADDVIGTICRQVSGKQVTGNTQRIDQVVIITGDRDILQLVSDEKVLIFMPTKGLSEGKLYGEKEVVERMGVIPARIADLKALMGDASDNYPGVAGVGPKTAVSLLDQFGSVEKIYKALDRVNGDMTKTKLQHGRESAFLGKYLATIRTDAPVTFEPVAARLTTLDTPKARAMLETLHFPSLLKRLSGQMPVEKKTKQTKELKKQKTVSDDQQVMF